MYSGLIGKTSPVVDLNQVLTGQWDERDYQGWHIVMTPFFTTMDSTVNSGSVPIPYTVTRPVAGLLFGNSGKVYALVIKPNTTAVVCEEPGYLQIQVFGDASQLKAVR